MTITLQTIDIRSETRLRLFFSTALAIGAFGAPAPAFYLVTTTDGSASDAVVQAALLVSGNPSVVELALDRPLVRGALYTVSAIGVPAGDASTTNGTAHTDIRWGLTRPAENVEPSLRDRDLLLYGIDLLWNGTDFEKTATGDLARVSGTPNVSKALNRVIEAEDLPWDSTYGAKARDYVDSPSAASGTLKGSMTAAILRDPRVKTVKMAHQIDESKTFIFADPTTIAGEPIERVSITVPS